MASIYLRGAVQPREGGPGTSRTYRYTIERSAFGLNAAEYSWSVAGAAGPGLLAADANDFVGGVLPSGTVTFAPGDLRQTITISVAGDDLPELNESFTVTPANPSAGAALGRASASAAILDDDAEADIAVIGDFDAAGGELIDLSRIDAIAGTGADDAFAFIGTAAFSGSAGELSVADIGGGLQMIAGDVNGDAVGDFAVLLLLPPEAQASWFVL